jgi:UDP-N-acetyl-D-mannosaminuronic acid dehydrogenase
MRVCVIGLGYIGLPTALLFSSTNDVLGVDINPRVVTLVNNKNVPFCEPELDFFLAASDMTAAGSPQSADAFIICVPTPLDKELKTADLTFVQQALKSIARYVCKGNIIIVESTVPPGTFKGIIVPFLEELGFHVGTDIYVAYCPERAMPGRTLYEMVHNDRIIGVMDSTSGSIARELYAGVVKGKLMITSATIAEFVKLMENTYRDVTIALVNEFATIADEFGADIWEAISLANHHPRVALPNPGPGVGGHCIAVDPNFLIQNAAPFTLIKAAREVNDFMPVYVLKKLKAITQGIQKPKITVFGVAYKGNVGDTRESPAIRFIKLAENDGFDVSIFDPLVTSFEYKLSSLSDAVKNTDCVVIMTDHDEFKRLDYDRLMTKARHKNVLDTRNVVSEARNCHLFSLGRGNGEESDAVAAALRLSAGRL